MCVPARPVRKQVINLPPFWRATPVLRAASTHTESVEVSDRDGVQAPLPRMGLKVGTMDAKRWAHAFTLVGLLGWAAPVLAQEADPVTQARAALEQALANAMLSLPVVTFVKSHPTGFGMYEKRDGSSFKSGETMQVYLEPQAYKYKQTGDDIAFGMTMDFSVLNKDGTILGGKEKFLDVTLHSHHRNTEIMLNASVNIQNAPPGEYQLELVVHDQSSPDVARARLPFVITP